MDSILDRLLADIKKHLYHRNYHPAMNLIFKADRRLVSLLLWAKSQERYDALCYYQYKLLALYISALYRVKHENYDP